MSNENALRALVATKQLEIDKLKRKIKEMENDPSRQRDTKDRKKDKREKRAKKRKEGRMKKKGERGNIGKNLHYFH